MLKTFLWKLGYIFIFSTAFLKSLLKNVMHPYQLKALISFIKLTFEQWCICIVSHNAMDSMWPFKNKCHFKIFLDSLLVWSTKNVEFLHQSGIKNNESHNNFLNDNNETMQHKKWSGYSSRRRSCFWAVRACWAGLVWPPGIS